MSLSYFTQTYEDTLKKRYWKIAMLKKLCRFTPKCNTWKLKKNRNHWTSLLQYLPANTNLWIHSTICLTYLNQIYTRSYKDSFSHSFEGRRQGCEESNTKKNLHHHVILNWKWFIFTLLRGPQRGGFWSGWMKRFSNEWTEAKWVVVVGQGRAVSPRHFENK